MVSDEVIRRRAADLGARNRAENGVVRAAELLERYFDGGTKGTSGTNVCAA